jgi:hypothetical protein
LKKYEDIKEFVEENPFKIDFNTYFTKIGRDKFVCNLCKDEQAQVLTYSKDFVRHYKFQCPNIIVECMGCAQKFRGKRKDVKLHEKDCPHITELCRQGCWQKV